MKNILLIGSGGREHALAWSLAQSSQHPKIYCTPGNPGIAEVAECVAIKADNLDAIEQFVLANRIELVAIGPEVPLILGLVDRLEARGIACFGPSAAAAQLEGSKAFSKALMHEAHIPTAKFVTFTDYNSAKNYLEDWMHYPVVIKASGLAAGKGVVIARDESEADATLVAWLRDGKLGDSGKTVVIEEYLDGEEASLFVLSDGESYQILPPSQDHKRMLEDDRGPNTGGMGSCTPSPAITDSRLQQTIKRIVEPTLNAMKKRGIPFRGVLFIGLMFVGDEPYVLEYNVRFGDPETQSLLPLLNCDTLELLLATANGTLSELQGRYGWQSGDWKMLAKPNLIQFCVVLAARGYPGSPVSGTPIQLPKCKASQILFHAGTKLGEDGKLVTAGGRVLNAIGAGKTTLEAQRAAFELAQAIQFAGKHYRHDIGHRMLGTHGEPRNIQGVRLTVLGSGSGMPSVDRTPSAYWLETDTASYLIDAGEDVARTILRLGIDHSKLRALFLSHTHPDHVSGLPMLLQMLHLAKRKTPLAIYLPEDKIEIFRNYYRNLYLHEQRLSFPFSFHPLGVQGYSDETMKLDTFPTTHLEKYREWCDPLQIGCVSNGFRIRIADRLIVYPSDIPNLDEVEQYLSDADLLLIEATHIPAQATIDLAAKHRIPRIVLTHIPAAKEKNILEWHTAAMTSSIPLFEVAVDGLVVNL